MLLHVKALLVLRDNVRGDAGLVSMLAGYLVGWLTAALLHSKLRNAACMQAAPACAPSSAWHRAGKCKAPLEPLCLTR